MLCWGGRQGKQWDQCDLKVWYVIYLLSTFVRQLCVGTDWVLEKQKSVRPDSFLLGIHSWLWRQIKNKGNKGNKEKEEKKQCEHEWKWLEYYQDSQESPLTHWIAYPFQGQAQKESQNMQTRDRLNSHWRAHYCILLQGHRKVHLLQLKH